LQSILDGHTVFSPGGQQCHRPIASTTSHPRGVRLRGCAGFGFGSERLHPLLSVDPLTAWSADPHAVNAPLLTEVLTRRGDSPQADLPLASEGVLRYVLEGKFGSMLIEVKDGQSYVNGQAVEPAGPDGRLE
jgi:hypothetical protein